MLLYNIFSCHSRPSWAPCGWSDSTQYVLNTLSLLTKPCPGTLQSGVQTPVGAAPWEVLHHISSFFFDAKRRNTTWIPKFAHAHQNSWFATLESHPLIAATLNHLTAGSETEKISSFYSSRAFARFGNKQSCNDDLKKFTQIQSTLLLRLTVRECTIIEQN